MLTRTPLSWRSLWHAPTSTVSAGSDSIDASKAGSGLEAVVGTLIFFPQGGSKQIILPNVPAGVRTFSISEPYGLWMNATVSVTEFKR